MLMVKTTAAKTSEPKAGGASGLLRKARGAAPEAEMTESRPTRVHPVDVNRVPMDPPKGHAGRPGLVNARVKHGAGRESGGCDWEADASSKAPSEKSPFAGEAVFQPATTHGLLQAKLEVGSVDDPLEQEADQVAEKVLRMPDPAAAAGAPELPMTAARARLSRKCAGCTEDEDGEKGPQVQRRAAPGATAGLAEAPPIVNQTLRGGGRALDEEVRAYFESRLRFDLSKVRIHTDARAAESARAVNAHAYTVGPDIVFGQGRYAPGEREGKRLLAHELTHVAQQGAAGAMGGAASARAVRREPTTREENLAAFRAALAAAATDPAKYDDVALRLNGFNREDIQRLTAGLAIEQARGTRAAAERVLRGWPEQQTILDGIDAGTVQKGVVLRPQSSSIWAGYSKISYAAATTSQAWDIVGGSVARDNNTQSTCATRVSYGLNYGGYPIRDTDPKWILRNDPNVTYAASGKAGDDKKYIISAPYLETFLRSKWGPADAILKTKDELNAFRASLGPDQVAIFSGHAHAGLIMKSYTDLYIYSGGPLLPISAWKLP